MRAHKVLVVGAAEAGKSTLIQALSPGAMNLEVRGRTVAMDHGSLDLEDRRVSLVGVPGQRRFEPVREVLAAGAAGVVWVHRDGQPVDPDTARLVARLAAARVPYLVLVNRPAGSPRGGGWARTDGLPRPRAVLAGDPRTDASLVRLIKEEIRRLAANGGAGSGPR